jgi:hypothetical protein
MWPSTDDISTEIYYTGESDQLMLQNAPNWETLKGPSSTEGYVRASPTGEAIQRSFLISTPLKLSTTTGFHWACQNTRPKETRVYETKRHMRRATSMTLFRSQDWFLRTRSSYQLRLVIWEHWVVHVHWTLHLHRYPRCFRCRLHFRSYARPSEYEQRVSRVYKIDLG